MKQLLKQKKGMTIIELLLSLTILTIVVLPFSEMFLNATRIEKSSANYMKATQMAQKLMEKHMNTTILSSEISSEGAASPILPVVLEEGLRAEIYYYDYSSVNEYKVVSAGLPSNYDIIARLEKSPEVPSNLNKVFYSYYDGGIEKTFDSPTTSYDIIDTDLSTDTINTKTLRLKKTIDGKVLISISKEGSTELQEAVELKATDEVYNLGIEFYGGMDGKQMQYRISNESDRKLSIYRIDNIAFNPSTGKMERITNKVGIIAIKGTIKVMNNTLGQDYTSGKHYKIRIKVTTIKDESKVLTELYGISK